MVGAVGLGALIFFLLRRTRGDDVSESVESLSETVRSGAEGEAGESPTGQEEATAEGQTEARRRTVRRFVDRLEEQRPADQEEGQIEEASEGPRKGTREELRSIVRESVRRSEGSSRSSRERGSEETAEEEERTGERAGEQVTVAGVLAKMGEAFEETGGGRFIISSETDGNFDLHGKEDELDEIYQQQIQAEVVGRITDEDVQPRVMEVDEVRSA
jgi:hypothetical protein